MYQKISNKGLWFIFFATFFLHFKTFAIVEGTHTISASIKSEKHTQSVAKENVAEPTTKNKMAIAGFCVSLVGILGLLAISALSVYSLLLGLVAGIIGIVLSTIALKRIKKSSEKTKGKGLATAGLVIGILSTALTILIFIGILLALANFQ
jgi:hypothetical protein